MMNNGSIYLHVYFTKSGIAPNAKDSGFSHNLKAYAFKSEFIIHLLGNTVSIVIYH